MCPNKLTSMRADLANFFQPASHLHSVSRMDLVNQICLCLVRIRISDYFDGFRILPETASIFVC